MANRFTHHFPGGFFRRPCPAAWLIILPALLICLILRPAPALALSNFIGEAPEVYFENSTLHLSLRLSVDDEDGLRLLLRNGAVLELSLSIAIERKRALWKNERIANLEFHSLVKFDPLTRYYLMLNPLTQETLQSNNLRALLAQTWKNLDLPLLASENFISGEDYLTTLSLALQYTELPPWLNQPLVFWSRDVVHPETHKMEFHFNDASISR